MALQLAEVLPDIEDLVTEDDEPVDNIPSEKQQRLLTEPLYSSWEGPSKNKKFLAASNVGVFYATHLPPVVPDVFVSLDVEVHPDWWNKKHRSYFIWEFGKPPDIAVEVVSNLEGKEDTEKLRKYAWMRVSYYVIYDPQQLLSNEVLRIFELRREKYVRHKSLLFPNMNLGLVLWQGEYESYPNTWLRWTDNEGKLISTGKELARLAQMQANQAKLRAEKLAEMLRQLGVNPDEI